MSRGGRLPHLVVVAVLLIGGLAVVSTLRRSYIAESGLDTLEQEISRRVGAEVRIGRVRGNLVGHTVLDDVSVRTKSGTEVRVSRVEARYSLADLIRRRHLKEARLIEPVVRIERGEEGGAEGDKKPFRFPSIPISADRIFVEGGVIADRAFHLDGVAFSARLAREDGKAAVHFDRLKGSLELVSGRRVPLLLEGTAVLGPEDACSLAVTVEAAGSRVEHVGALRLGSPVTGRGELRLAPLDIDEGLRLAGKEAPESQAEAVIRYRGRPDSLAVEIAGSGAGGGIVVDRVAASGSLVGRLLRLDTMEVETGGAKIGGEVSFDFGAAGTSRASLAFENLDPARFTRALEGRPPSDIRGSLTWEGTGKDRESVRGRVLLRVDESRVAGASLRGATVSGTVDRAGITVEESTVRLAEAVARFDGFVGFDGQIRGQVIGDVPSVAELRELSGIDSLSGSARFEIRVDAAGGKGRAEGSLAVEEGVVGAVAFGDLLLDGWVARGEEGVTARAKARVHGGSVAGQAFDSLLADVAVEGSRLRLENLHGRRGTWDLAASGVLNREEAADLLVLDHFVVRHGDTTIVAPDRIVLRKAEDRVSLEPFSFRFDGGRIEAEASRRGDGALRARLRVDSADLGRLAGLVHVPPALLSSVDLEATYAESAGAREGEIALRCRPPAGPELPIREIAVSASLAGAEVTIDSVLLLGLAEGARLRGEGTFGPLGEEARIQLLVRSEHLPLADLRPLSARFADFEGVLSGEVRAGGTLRSPRIDASLSCVEAAFRGYPLGTVEVDTVRLGGDSLVFAFAFDSNRDETNRAKGLLPLRFSPLERQVHFLPDAPMSVEMDIPRGDLRFLALLAGRGDEAIGDFALKGKLGGTARSPTLEGTLETKDALIFPAKMALSLERASARLLLDEDYITIVSFEARSGKRGRLNAWGRVDLKAFRPVAYDITFRAHEYDVLLADNLELTFDGELTLRPDPTVLRAVVPHVEGEARIRGALISQEFGEEEEGVPSILDATDTPEWTCNVLVRAPRNLWVRNNIVDIELEGEARVRRSDQGLGALGQFSILRGSFYAYPNEFRIESGEISFPNPDDLRDARIDVTAHTDVRGERIDVRAYGGNDDIRVEPTSASGYTEGEILGMLTLRARRDEEIRSGEVLSSWFQTLAGRASRQLTRGLGDIGTIQIGTSDELPELQYGNYVSSDLYFGFSQKIDTGMNPAEQERSPTREYLAIPDREVRVEYRLQSVLTVEGEVGTLRNGNRFLNLDLKVRLPY